MTILLTLYLAGMPLALAVIIYAVQGLPREDVSEVSSIRILAAVSVWVLLWPYWLAKVLHETWSER